jgi:hypothetical protein
MREGDPAVPAPVSHETDHALGKP